MWKVKTGCIKERQDKENVYCMVKTGYRIEKQNTMKMWKVKDRMQKARVGQEESKDRI